MERKIRIRWLAASLLASGLLASGLLGWLWLAHGNPPGRLAESIPTQGQTYRLQPQGAGNGPQAAGPALKKGSAAQPTAQPAKTPLLIAAAPVAPADNAGLPPAPDTVQAEGLRVREEEDQPWKEGRPAAGSSAGGFSDPLVQGELGPQIMPAPLLDFEGTSNLDAVLPPDADGEVGRSDFIQMVNLSLAIYRKDGTLRYGPFHLSSLWPVGDPCRANNDGDPVALYDQLADRWLISEFAVPGPQYYECIAVSKTGSPTNLPADWSVYTFPVLSNKMNDYPKLAVWPDGYYMSANQFDSRGNWAGAGVFVFERSKMLAGQAARQQYVDLAPVSLSYGGMLPADLDGAAPPPAGSPAYFIEVDNDLDTPSLGADALRIWQFHVDWTNQANTTFGLNNSGQPNALLPVAPFDTLPCNQQVNSKSCIPQKSSAQRLDGISDRLMFRAAYRNFGDHESVALNHTVLVSDTLNGATDRSGIRWYELRSPRLAPTIYQQGTFAPQDGLYRWMGSLAMDQRGDLALGYSVSGPALDPSIRYTGRLASDPPGKMGLGEGIIMEGSGAQTHSSGRWGDYSAMTVDPTDDCTFWYTQEYVRNTGIASWQTRIASFRFAACPWSLSGKVRDAQTGWPLYARITIDGGSAAWDNPLSGAYSLSLPSGQAFNLHISAWAPGYLAAVKTVGPLSADQTLDIALSADPAACDAPGYARSGSSCQPAPGGLVIGNVLDANTGLPVNGVTLRGDRGQSSLSRASSDPANPGGFYTLFSPSGSHTITASLPGYVAQALPVSVPLNGAVRRDFNLPAGRLVYNPALVEVSVPAGGQAAASVAVTNTGQASASYSLSSVNISEPGTGLPLPAAVNWMIASPTGATLAPNASQAIHMTLDSARLRVGVYEARLKFTTNTPYALADLIVRLVVYSTRPVFPFIVR